MVQVKKQINKSIDNIDKVFELEDYGLYYSSDKITFVLFKFIKLNFYKVEKYLFINRGIGLQINIDFYKVTPKKTSLEIELKAVNFVGTIYLFLFKRYFSKRISLFADRILT